MMVLMSLVVLAGCAESATEPEAPPGWQVVVEASGSYGPIGAVVSNTDLSTISALVRGVGSGGNAFAADLQDGDTLLVGYTFGIGSSGGVDTLRLTGSMITSPTSRHPIQLHDFTVILDFIRFEGKTTVTEQVAERQPAENDFFTTLYPFPPSDLFVGYSYNFFVLRAVTCEREGRNTLQSRGFVLRYEGLNVGGSIPINLPDITVTCHRAVSSASVRGPLL